MRLGHSQSLSVSLSVSLQVEFAKQPYNHLKKRFPSLSENGFNLLNKFLTYDPVKRITAEDALKHSYFEVSVFILFSNSRTVFKPKYMRKGFVYGLG